MEPTLLTNQVSPQVPVQKTKKKFWLISASGLVVLGLVGAGIYLYIRNHKATPAVFVYQNYNAHVVTGVDNKSGMKFKAPATLTQISKTAFQLDLGQTWISGQTQGLTYLVAITQPNSDVLSTEDLSNIDVSLSSPTASDYRITTGLVKSFVQKIMIQGWQSRLDNAVQFTNPDIKKHAWSFNFTATPSKGPGKVQGKVIYVITAKTSYYLLIYSNSHNWQANTSTWQKIFNSIEVNQ